MSHTPEPWIAKGEKIWNADEVMYVAAKNFNTINPSQTLKANARLIAAAPEMLKCLQAIVARIHGVYDDPALIEWGGLHHDSDQDILEHAEKLITKATGE